MALTVQFQKRYGSFSLNVDFTAEDGEALALLGASGSGKSVTLKCIAGIDRPDRGRIVLDGQVLFDSAAGIDLPPQKRKIGFLFQQYALFPNMTVERNISACVRNSDKAERSRRTEELISMLRLKGLEGLYPRQLSGGQQQRTALARILVSEPEVILLDEPFSALDSFLRWQLELDLRDVLDRFPGPVLWVSHDRGEVYRNCRRVCVLEDGKSLPAEDMGELMTNPVTVSAARLSGCQNFVPLVPEPELCMVRIPDWRLSLRSAVPWREGIATLGIRAEHIHPAAPGEVNAFPCRVVRATEDVSSMLILLRPEGAGPSAPLLRMELGKEAWAALTDRAAILTAVRPEDLMLLESGKNACVFWK